MCPDRQTAERAHVRARPQFTDCSQQEEPRGFSFLFPPDRLINRAQVVPHLLVHI